MAGSQAVSLSSNAGIAAQLERMAYHALADDYVDTYREILGAVSHADVTNAARRYLGPDGLIIAAAGSFTPVSATP
jgi:predicted Zn-dependent peptidase